MKKIFIKRAIIVMSSLFIIGVICLFNSAKAGENARFRALQKYVGVNDSIDYSRIEDTTTLNFQIMGGVLSLIGGYGGLMIGYAIYKELE